MDEISVASDAGIFAGMAIDAALDRALVLVEELGFTSVIYDYTPVPLSHDGTLITPSVLRLRNAPEDMEELWLKQGYYQHDPVQDAALAVARPFVWSYGKGPSPVLESVLRPTHQRVVDYLNDRRLTCGITVPIHLPGGDLATFTAMRVDPERDFLTEAVHARSEIGSLGYQLHDAVYAGFDANLRTCQHVKLTSRERQCLGLCAEGMSAKVIAHRIGRSIPTVMLHLGSATRKLGARNRFQAIARAAHYRLLDTTH